MILGNKPEGKEIPIDLHRLSEMRLLIRANSNALSKLRTLGLLNGHGAEPVKISGELV